MRLSRPTYVAGLIVAAFLIRAGAVAALRGFSEGPTARHGADGPEYNLFASRLAQGLGYTSSRGAATSWRPPGFPFFLASLYRLVGENYAAAYVAFCLLGALSCVLSYLLARELLSENLARVAGVLGAVYFPNIYGGTTFYSESLYVPCQALGVWLFIRQLKRGSAPGLGVVGLVLGFAALTRPFALLLLPILGGILILRDLRYRRIRLLGPLALAAGCVAVIAPWTLRNYHVHGRPVLVATNGGTTFYGGNNDIVLNQPAYLGAWVSPVHLPGRELVESMPDEVSHDQMEWRLGRHWIEEHWQSLPLLWLYKFVRLWLPLLNSPNKQFVIAGAVAYAPFLVLFSLGSLWCLRHRSCWTAPWLAVHGTVLATVFTALLFVGDPRYRDANMPLLMLYAALGLRVLWPTRWRGSPVAGKAGPVNPPAAP